MATTHGHAGSRSHGKWVRFPSPTYVSWEGMRRRVTPVHTQHKHYVGIGICDRWKSFENFLADMGERPEGMTLDRIDVTGDYCPENCRWADWSTQNKNRRPFRRKDNRLLTKDGITLPLADWSRRLGINTETIRRRLKKGLSESDALVCTRLARRSD